MLHIVIAPDSFKGSLRALEVGKAIEKGVHTAMPNSTVRIIPMADGGEGMLEAILTAVGGERIAIQVQDPLHREIEAYIGIIEGDTCIVELAQASGLDLLAPEERNPLYTSTYGFGQSIVAGLNRGCTSFIIGLGGSATNDAGVGMLRALGYRFLDAEGVEVGYGGGELDRIARIDTSMVDARLAQARFTVACDVNNPFIGEKGASRVYAPQKGATPDIVDLLEHSLTHFADIVLQATQVRIHDIPGAGAAGGVAGAFYAFLPATLEAGAQIIAKITKLEDAIANADLVITGEGKIDAQTLHGKTALHIAQIAKHHAVPTVALVGTVGDGIEQLYAYGFSAIWSIINRPMSLEQAMQQTAPLLTQAAEQVARLCHHFHLAPATKEIVEDSK